MINADSRKSRGTELLYMVSRLNQGIQKVKRRHRVRYSVVILCSLLVVFVLYRLPRCDPHRFQAGLDLDEKVLLLDTLDALTHVLATANIPFFLIGGTLLGSWRHHGIVPWDDEVDLMVSIKHKKNVSDLLQQLKPRYVLNEEQKVRWKFYSSRAQPIGSKTWSFPFVDINFYHVNDTRLWDDDVHNWSEMNYRKDHVFPLALRPFEGRQLPTPYNVVGILSTDIRNLEMCQPNSFSHREETSVTPCEAVPCSELYSHYPFVHRSSDGSAGCRETLMLNGTVLRLVVLHDQVC